MVFIHRFIFAVGRGWMRRTFAQRPRLRIRKVVLFQSSQEEVYRIAQPTEMVSFFLCSIVPR